MGSRDFRKRESKKAKKGGKKAPLLTIMPPTTEVELIKKGKKEPREEE
ncbi:MAG TPA: hypothetical protein VMW61_03105 [Dehalococcoidales bacterium]|nr:hypothetical protein [Dehalococcoidales bacterium]